MSRCDARGGAGTELPELVGFDHRLEASTVEREEEHDEGRAAGQPRVGLEPGVAELVVDAGHDGEQPVLRIELLRDRVAAQRDARDPPVAAPLREHGVRVDGLMRAMERAGAEVHDADAVSARIVGRAPDPVGHRRERRAGQTPRAARATDSAHASL